MAVNLPGGLNQIPISLWGFGPGGDTGLPRWRCTQESPTPSNTGQILSLADQHNMTIVLNLAGARTTFTNPGPNNTLIYDPQKYEERVRRFEGDPDVADGIARRRFIPFTVDEPNISPFNNTITRKHVNDQGLLIKSIWPGALTVVRALAATINALPNPGGEFNGIWTGLDYGISQFNRPAALSNGNGAAQRRVWFTARRADFLAIDMGMIPTFNWLDGSDGRLWDFLNNGTSSGRIEGPLAAPRYMMAPVEIRETVDAIFDDPDAPCFSGYVYPGEIGSTVPYVQYVTRSDFVSAFDYMLNKFLARPTFNGFRTAKGTAPPPPPPTDIAQRHTVMSMGIGTKLGVRKAGF